MAEKIQKTALRIPEGLHKRIINAADKSGRSMNAEIVHRLENSFTRSNIERAYLQEHSEEIVKGAVAALREKLGGVNITFHKGGPIKKGDLQTFDTIIPIPIRNPKKKDA